MQNLCSRNFFATEVVIFCSNLSNQFIITIFVVLFSDKSVAE